MAVQTTRTPVLGVIAVTLGIFSIVTTEILPIGLLTTIGPSFDLSPGRTGLLMTIPGLVAAVAAPVITVLTARLDRRLMLTALMVLLAASDVLAAAAPAYWLELVARVMVGMTIGGFWSIGAGLAVRLVPERWVARATAVIFSAVPLGSVLGVPAGTFLGEHAGWRTSFVVLGLLTVGVLIALLWSVPPLPPLQVTQLSVLRHLLTLRGTRTGLLVTCLIVTAHFSTYTYVGPFLRDVTGVPADHISGLLLIYGAAGFVGNLVAGTTAATRLRATFATSAGLLAVATLLLPVVGRSTGGAVVLLVVWGLAYGAVPVCSMTWFAQAAPQAREAATVVFTSSFQATLSLGALVGGLVVDSSSVSTVMVCGGPGGGGGRSTDQGWVHGICAKQAVTKGALVDQLTLGVVGRSRKENEHRLPIHPNHFERIDEDLRQRIYLESGYGEQFGVSDAQLSRSVAGILDRKELIATADIMLLPKPQIEDVGELRQGQVLWGWPHCVQDEKLTQLAIDRELTLIAFEAMNHWTADGRFNLHVFHKNNELAGYCSVLHALEMIGSTGVYGRRLRAVVIGFGATARGAVTALSAHGIHDVDVLTGRDVAAVGSPIHSARMVQYDQDEVEPGARLDPRRSHALLEDGRVPLAGFLAEHDIIVNCVLQDPDAPLTFLIEEDLALLEPGSLIVDVSCDLGMGFSWARPTGFNEPTFTVGNNITYYGVDHTPSYLWNSASWEISEALLPYLEPVLGGPETWQADETIRRAIEIQHGRIKNPGILSFQGRSPEYPHALL